MNGKSDQKAAQAKGVCGFAWAWPRGVAWREAGFTMFYTCFYRAWNRVTVLSLTNQRPHPMKRPSLHPAFLLLTLLSVLGTSCEAQPLLEAQQGEGTGIHELDSDPYALTLRLEGSAEDGYQLVAHVALDSGSWFVSPYSADRYQGYFTLSITDNDSLHLDRNFVETPKSMPRPDRWEGGLSHFVEQNTSYTYGLSVRTEKDFKVLGMVRFVIEPKCTLEEIPFSISQQSGKLTVLRYPKLDKRTCTKVN